MSDKTLWVAVIGAGPAGYYTAEALTSTNNRVRVDIIDRLPTPYGLIRAGVAPDHQSIKAVARRYEKTNTQDNVRFIGNLVLGRDITLAELQDLYDVVVLATGAAKDRSLGIEGEALPGVIGSSAFVSWYNAHPDFTNLNPDLNVPCVAVVGNGNVAIDVARVLAKTAEEMKNSDLADHAADTIHPAPVRDIYILGRRGPLDASFTPKELGELNRLDNAVTLIKDEQLPTSEMIAATELSGAAKKNMAILDAMKTNRPGDKPLRIHLEFYVRPMAILGSERVCGLRLEKTRVQSGKCVGTGVTEVLPAGLIVPCIGYSSSPIEDVPYNEVAGRFISEDGRIDERLYCVGWARRGPTGTIGTNKPDGNAVAAKILDEVQAAGRDGRVGLDKLIRERELDIVTFEDWKRIEAAEVKAAHGEAPRVKFSDVDDMLAAAHPDSA